MDARNLRSGLRRLHHRAYSQIPRRRGWNEEHPTVTGPFFDILVLVALIVTAIGALLS